MTTLATHMLSIKSKKDANEKVPIEVPTAIVDEDFVTAKAMVTKLSSSLDMLLSKYRCFLIGQLNKELGMNFLVKKVNQLVIFGLSDLNYKECATHFVEMTRAQERGNLDSQDQIVRKSEELENPTPDDVETEIEKRVDQMEMESDNPDFVDGAE